MTLERFLVRSVTILKPSTTTDRYGNALPDWTSPTSTVASAWASQNSAQLIQGERIAGETSDFTFVFGPDVDIDSGYRVLMDGATYEVQGPPNVAWRGVTGEAHHIEAQLRRVEG